MEPAVYVGKPEDEENYFLVESSGLKFYIMNSAKIEQDEISISMVGIGPWKRLLVTGLAA